MVLSILRGSYFIGIFVSKYAYNLIRENDYGRKIIKKENQNDNFKSRKPNYVIIVTIYNNN